MTITEFIEARITEWEWRSANVTRQQSEDIDLKTTMIYNPERWRTCQAMRQTVATLTHVATTGPSESWNPADTALVDVLVHLAAIWSDHPDYNQGWAPDTPDTP